MKSDQVVEFLQKRFPDAVKQIQVKRETRIFAETTPEKLLEVLKALKEWGMINVGTITGLDLAGEKFEVMYHLYDNQGVMLNLKIFVPGTDPVIPSIIGIYPGSVLYERELVDLLGIKVTGLPPGFRYPLPDSWPEGQYPLRKDWKGLARKEEVMK